MIKELVEFNERLANGDLEVKPGQNESISPAASIDDFCWQGDLKLTILGAAPAGYSKLEKPSNIDRQVVPGKTKGAKHCLEHLNNVNYFVPKGWHRDESYDEADGPAIFFAKENNLMHEEHGNISIPANTWIGFSYQKDLDVETQKIKRRLD